MLKAIRRSDLYATRKDHCSGWYVVSLLVIAALLITAPTICSAQQLVGYPGEIQFAYQGDTVTLIPNGSPEGILTPSTWMSWGVPAAFVITGLPGQRFDVSLSATVPIAYCIPDPVRCELPPDGLFVVGENSSRDPRLVQSVRCDSAGNATMQVGLRILYPTGYPHYDRGFTISCTIHDSSTGDSLTALTSIELLNQYYESGDIDGSLDGLSPGVTYTLTPDSAGGDLQPRRNGQEIGAVARFNAIVDSGGVAVLYWSLPTTFARDDESSAPIPCSFEPGSVTIRELGLRLDPNQQTAFVIGGHCVLNFEIGVTVSVPPGTPPGTYTAQLVASLGYVGNTPAPRRVSTENSPLFTLRVIDATIPDRASLLQNYPNPFNGPTKIRFGLAQPEEVRLEIVDILGRVVETLVDGPQYAGWHDVEWNAAGEASGVYFVRLRGPSITQVKKLLLAR